MTNRQRHFQTNEATPTNTTARHDERKRDGGAGRKLEQVGRRWWDLKRLQIEKELDDTGDSSADGDGHTNGHTLPDRPSVTNPSF